MDYTTQDAAETVDDFVYPIEEFSNLPARKPEAGPTHAIEVPAETRRVWHDFLGQHHVAAAVLSVALPGANGPHHAFLIGFDAIRGDVRRTECLLEFADRAWAKLGQQPSIQFRCTDAPDAMRDSTVGELLAGFDYGIAAQIRHSGAIVRAMYLRGRGDAGFDANEIASLQLVLPLLADSAARDAQMAQQARRSKMLEAMFDRVSLAMMMLSGDGQPLFMNSAANAMLEKRNWLIRAADGSITCTNTKQAKQLRESVRLAATAGSADPIENVYRLDDGNGEWRLAYVLSATSGGREDGSRCALLFVMAPGKMDAPSHMLEALGLLPSEQRFLGHFLKSSSLCDAAIDCGLSEETARTYLKRVRAKLGVHRQMELAGLISGLVLPLHGGHPHAGGQ
ncbi:MAG: sigma-70 region 4 domain-containing protein [Sphingomonadales bacterium]|nr:sigma-70 region 4 domain-containing protein [Sphingomonadales bacterium]MBP6434081.1 sigma-70 region 4 domain-containing protein [Sphingorhabdus sp.]